MKLLTVLNSFRESAMAALISKRNPEESPLGEWMASTAIVVGWAMLVFFQVFVPPPVQAGPPVEVNSSAPAVSRPAALNLAHTICPDQGSTGVDC